MLVTFCAVCGSNNKGFDLIEIAETHVCDHCASDTLEYVAEFADELDD